MTAVLFAGYVALIAAAVIAVSLRFLPTRAGRLVALGLPAWLAYVGLLGIAARRRETGAGLLGARRTTLRRALARAGDGFART